MQERLQKRLQELLEQWDPIRRAVHCSNCIHARVQGFSQTGWPLAHCRKGHGYGDAPIRPLYLLIRMTYSKGWRRAKECEDFEAAEDDVANVRMERADEIEMILSSAATLEPSPKISPAGSPVSFSAGRVLDRALSKEGGR